jgi:hypothetical protein
MTNKKITEYSDEEKIEMIRKFDLLPEQYKDYMYKKYGKENIEALKRYVKELEDDK